MRESNVAASIVRADMWRAAKPRTVHGDFEDNLALVAAEKESPTLLVTNDEQLIRHAAVATFTPTDALATLKARR